MRICKIFNNFVLFFSVWLFFCNTAYSVTTWNIELVDGSIVKFGEFGISKIGVANLLFQDQQGDMIPAEDQYIMLLYGENNSPAIGAKIPGYSIIIDISDADGDGDKELVAYFFSGGNQYGVRLFEFAKEGLVPFCNQPVFSNMRSIEVKNNKIIVKNKSYDIDTERKEVETVYDIKNGKCVLAR